MPPVALAYASVVLVSLVSLIGLLTLSMSEARIRRLAVVFISFAVGALLGETFIHLVPEIFGEASAEDSIRSSLLVLAGMLMFFVVEKLLRHHHGFLHRHHHGEVEKPALAGVNLLGDAVHNYLDGLLIGASWMVSPAIGLGATIAVLLHEIPQELGDFAVLVHSGLSVRRAVLLNLAVSLVAVLGTTTAIVAGSVAQERANEVLMPLTAGGFVYIAAANLIPELQHERGIGALVMQTGIIALGIGVMALLTLLE